MHVPAFLPGTVPGGDGFANLALAVGGDVALGTYTITVTAVGGGITHSSAFTLLVNLNAGDFIESVTPTKLSL